MGIADNRQNSNSGKLQITKDILKIVEPLFMDEIGSSILDGITYAVLANNDTNKIRINRYKNMIESLKESSIGSNSSEIVKAFKLCNGYVFDLNIAIAKKLAMDMIMESYRDYGVDFKPTSDIVTNMNTKPNDAVIAELKRLSEFCVKSFHKGNKEIYVILYNRSPRRKITYTSKYKGQSIQSTYDSFSVRHFDLAKINENYLFNKGVRIAKVEPCEVLHKSSGVKYRLVLEENYR